MQIQTTKEQQEQQYGGGKDKIFKFKHINNLYNELLFFNEPIIRSLNKFKRINKDI